MKDKKKYTSFTQYFKEEKDVWVQNVSKTQISLSFMTAPGQYIGRCIPRTRKPINLSQYVSWDAIKNSTDLKTIVNRRPAKLQLLDEEDALAYYENLAKEHQSTVEDEMDKAFEECTMLMDHIVPDFSETSEEEHELEDMKKKAAVDLAEIEGEDPQDIVTPRVVGLVEQTAEDVPQNERLGARQLKEELEVLQDDLTRADLDYLMANGSPTIHKWAVKVKTDRRK